MREGLEGGERGVGGGYEKVHEKSHERGYERMWIACSGHLRERESNHIDRVGLDGFVHHESDRPGLDTPIREPSVNETPRHLQTADPTPSPLDDHGLPRASFPSRSCGRQRQRQWQGLG